MKPIAAAIIMLLVSVTPARADMKTDTLRGLHAAALKVEVQGSAIPELTAVKMNTAARIYLLAGPTLLDSEEPGANDALVGVLLLLRKNEDKIIYTARVAVIQPVVLVRDQDIRTVVPTWEASVVNEIVETPNEVESSVRKLLGSLTDAWQAANPGQSILDRHLKTGH